MITQTFNSALPKAITVKTGGFRNMSAATSSTQFKQHAVWKFQWFEKPQFLGIEEILLLNQNEEIYSFFAMARDFRPINSGSGPKTLMSRKVCIHSRKKIITRRLLYSYYFAMVVLLDICPFSKCFASDFIFSRGCAVYIEGF